MPHVTVFTPTFNRAHLLPRVFECLRAQSYRDFEWLVVDDGSTDGTAELIRSWQEAGNSDFSIRYFWQENSSKKVAWNRGVREATGAFFVPLDDDDTMVPEAIQVLVDTWETIPPDRREGYSEVVAKAMLEDGTLSGPPFPGPEPRDKSFCAMRYGARVDGETLRLIRTDLLIDQPYPSHLPGYVPDTIPISRIGQTHLGRYINQPLRIYFRDDASTGIVEGGKVSFDGPMRNAPGHLYWMLMILEEELPWFRSQPSWFLLAGARLTRFYLYSPPEHRERFWPKTLGGKLIVAAMAPFGFGLWLVERLGLRRR